ncbi:hypothetical protein JK361_07320 [Streptomyces sp. 5-8]|uniref:Lipoprotein n=1 Tax=Streptomyces musisoli TaxID=2802280 RepID=A0ABS1NWD2_9ACTN|nr:MULTISPECIES: hypothetical protein [Streptomyces]MBL1104412.1 hypothetical protein [Streptomyces musisoli]MBY8840385.1 hypothetical protein [Streptomyces sp. SP2-10]
MRALRSLPAALAALCLLGGVSGCANRTDRTDRIELSPDDTIKAAQLYLTDRCLERQGLTPPRPGGRRRSEAEQQRVSEALFGSGPAELSVSLPTGYRVRAHTDGCLAAAQRSLYGDQRAWFHASTIVNNLKPEAAYRGVELDSVRRMHRAELADWRRMRSRAFERARALLDRSLNHRATGLPPGPNSVR